MSTEWPHKEVDKTAILALFSVVAASKFHSQKTTIYGAIYNKQNQCDRELRAAIGHSARHHCGCIVSLDDLFWLSYLCLHSFSLGVIPFNNHKQFELRT